MEVGRIALVPSFYRSHSFCPLCVLHFFAESLMSRQPTVFFECPHCGEDVPVGAKVCRECGACDEAGWNDDSDIDYSDIHDSHDDDYRDAIYDASRSPYDTDANAARVRFWVRLVILAIIISLLISMSF